MNCEFREGGDGFFDCFGSFVSFFLGNFDFFFVDGKVVFFGY